VLSQAGWAAALAEPASTSRGATVLIQRPASEWAHARRPPGLPCSRCSWKWSKPYAVEMARSLMVKGPDGELETRVSSGWRSWLRLRQG
jgi:hypothetical protein